MNNFQFHLPTNILFGRGVQSQAGRLTASLEKRALILHGSHRIEESGLLSQLTAQLTAEGVSYETFSGITENPRLSTALAACQVVRSRQIDVLLAVGGGSVIDLAKAVSIGSHAASDLWDYYEQRAVPETALPSPRRRPGNPDACLAPVHGRILPSGNCGICQRRLGNSAFERGRSSLRDCSCGNYAF